MTRLTPLELSIRHCPCGSAGCAICNERPVSEIAEHLKTLGFHIYHYSPDDRVRFASIYVLEDERTCTKLLSSAVPSTS